ncbi:MAG: hypothetical protein LPJ91_03725 [Pseudazoarcus pumilus]|nr:hypothetical protein [Pseudazoarcus pumilus]
MRRLLELTGLYCGYIRHSVDTWLDDQIDILKAEKELRDVADSFGQPDDSGNFNVHAALNADRNAHLWQAVSRTRRLVRIANARHLQLPPRESSAHWARVEYDLDPTEPYYLTNQGLVEVMPMVLEAKKHRRDAIVTIAAALTGVIGAITGLIAVIR